MQLLLLLASCYFYFIFSVQTAAVSLCVNTLGAVVPCSEPAPPSSTLLSSTPSQTILTSSTSFTSCNGATCTGPSQSSQTSSPPPTVTPTTAKPSITANPTSGNGSSAGYNPSLASLCENDIITPNAQAWTEYSVTAYITSILSAAPPSATTTGNLDGALALYSDVNPGGAVCTYVDSCGPISCSNVKDNEDGTDLPIQRYLAYNAMVNLNNFLYQIYYTMNFGGNLGGLASGDISNTFFTRTAPATTLGQMSGAITPLLGIASALLGPFSSAGGAAISSVSGLLGFITGVFTASTHAAVVDQAFINFGNITDNIEKYMLSAVVGIESAYNNTIGSNSSIEEWNSLFAAGIWADSNYAQDLNTNLLDNLVRIFTYKAINYAFNQSNVFIMYVPYGVAIKDTNGNLQNGGIDQSYCENNLQDTSELGLLTICDAPGGMARIFNADQISSSGNTDIMKTQPSGYDATFEILPTENFNITNAIRGSVASWLQGDFGYDASNPYNDTLGQGLPLTSDQIQSLSQLQINQSAPGFFNSPVCAVYDLRYFPPADKSTTIGCNLCSYALGGMPGSTAQFWNNVPLQVQTALAAPPNCRQGYESTSCSQACPNNPYGPTLQTEGSSGYTPGWCGMHAVIYQRNQGPDAVYGDDVGSNSPYRVNITIYDNQQIDISDVNNTLVGTVNPEWAQFSSKLPSTLGVQMGATDGDTIWFSYPGQGNWQIGDQQHHCNFGAWDGGYRQGDCGFTCA